MSAPDDGAEPQNLGSGNVQAELVGGFFVVCLWSGSVYGADYKAVQTLGFDVDKSVYAGTWVDSTMSYQWQLHGSLESNTKEFIVLASGPGPNGGTKNIVSATNLTRLIRLLSSLRCLKATNGSRL